jgi:hypothetical protein
LLERVARKGGSTGTAGVVSDIVKASEVGAGSIARHATFGKPEPRRRAIHPP